MPKRLILLCDGTGQSATRGDRDALPTNVKLLGDLLEPTYPCDLQHEPCKSKHKGKPMPKAEDREKHPQIIYYQAGVGTAEQSWMSGNVAAGLGRGVDDNITDAYSFLSSNYLDGDEIFVFGFSRGAFIARVVANLVARFGVLKKDKLWMLRMAWQQYRKPDKGLSFAYFLHRFISHCPKHSLPVKIKVLGVWDTVPAVGWPDYELIEYMEWNKANKFYDLSLRWGIENAFHALALDEYRLTFGPTLMYHPNPATRPQTYYPGADGEKPKAVYADDINLQQTWFAGAHTDIGGGYASEHQSNIALAWMVDHCLSRNLLAFIPFGIPRGYDSRNRAFNVIRDHHFPGDLEDGLRHQHVTRMPDMVSRNLPSFIQPYYKRMCEDEYPGWGCGIVRDSYKEMTSAVHWQYRTPGNYAEQGKHYGFIGPVPSSTTVKQTASSVGSAISSAASYANPFNWFGKSEPKEPSWDDLVKPGQEAALQKAIEGLPLCNRPECSHPKAADWLSKNAKNIHSTMETIHESVYLRWQKQVEYFAKYPAEPELSKEQAYPFEKPWVPASLSAFRVKPLRTLRPKESYIPSDATVPFRRIPTDKSEDKPTDPPQFAFKWRGECVKFPGTYFDVYEEPSVQYGETYDTIIEGKTWQYPKGLMKNLQDHDWYISLPVMKDLRNKKDELEKFDFLKSGYSIETAMKKDEKWKHQVLPMGSPLRELRDKMSFEKWRDEVFEGPMTTEKVPGTVGKTLKEIEQAQ